MNLGTKTFRLVASAVLGLTMIAGIGNTALAETIDVNVAAVGVTNVCTLANYDTSINLGTANWDPATLTYTKNFTSALLNGRLRATGEPGNRGCNVSATNTDFTDGNGHTLLSASALLANGASLNSQAAVTVNPVAWGNGTYWGGTMSIAPSATIDNHAVPAGAYKSTITVTLTSVGI